jgi:dihydrofolate synthase/folylpolyglutamate synthase
VFGERYGLERIRALLDELGDPQWHAPAVHVVGSNGKSSTARFAACALRAAGLRTGCYLSPHVTGWHERVEVDGRALSAADFGAALARVREAAEAVPEPVTQFEVLTATALLAFRRAEVQAVVVEAGLGGRFDATNVFDGRAVVVLTRIDLEHTALLGETVERIAAEKLAVLDRGARALVTGPLPPPVAALAAQAAHLAGAPLLRLGEELEWRADRERLSVRTSRADYPRLRPSSGARFQRDNLTLGIAAAEEVVGAPLAPGPLRLLLGGLRMPGRLEVAAHGPAVVLDGAHNPAAAAALAESLPDVTDARPVVLVLSVLDDKDARGIMRALREAVDRVVTTASDHPRAVGAEALGRLCAQEGLQAESAADPGAALERARALAGPDGAVLVAGSLYLIEDLRRCGVLRDG